MLIRKGFRFRLKANRFQDAKLLKFAGCNRFVWNMALSIQKERLANDLSCLSYARLCNMLVDMKSEFPFLKEVHSQTLQQTLKNLGRAIKDAFDKSSPKKFPKFKKRGVDDGFRFPQGFKLNDNVIYLPKIGWIPFFKSCDIEGTPKNVTISRQGKHWFVSVQTEIELSMPMHPSCGSVGLDLGVKRFVTLSDGSYFEPLNSFKRLEKKLVCEQRKLSRKKLKSQNWHKQKAVVNRIHTKIANARRDYLHKVSTIVSKNHALTVIEDLKVVNMSASARGTIESPGCNVRQKAGLNKAILDQGWSEFRRMLEYKQLWRGGVVVAVSPRHTSQLCPECNHVSAENRKSQMVFRCLACGFTANADYVASLNILAAGHAALARGEDGFQNASMKREPPRVAA
jgi:IS605 OrfB family transposase